MSDLWTREKIMEVAGGFMTARILLSAAELDLFSKLAKGSRTVEELSRQEGWAVRGLTILLDALVSTGFVRKSPEGSYDLAPPLAELLSTGSDRSVLPMLLHMVRVWKSWSNLTEIVQTGENRRSVELRERPPGDLEAFIGAMHVIGSETAERIADSVDLSRFNRMLDVGGGSGVYIMAFLKRAPHMRATLFDLPEVCAMGRRFLAQGGLTDRVHIVEGDFRTDDLPKGHDLVLLSAIIHMNSREGNCDLFRKSFQCLDPGGTIMIRDHIMDQSRTIPPRGAVFAVNMLVATEGGGTYTFQEVTDDLEAAGFRNVQLIRDGVNMDQLVSAVR